MKNKITNIAKQNFDKWNRSETKLSFTRCRLDKGYGAVLLQIYKGKKSRKEVLKAIFGNDDPRTNNRGYYCSSFYRLDHAGLIKWYYGEVEITKLGRKFIRMFI